MYVNAIIYLCAVMAFLHKQIISDILNVNANLIKFNYNDLFIISFY